MKTDKIPQKSLKARHFSLISAVLLIVACNTDNCRGTGGHLHDFTGINLFIYYPENLEIDRFTISVTDEEGEDIIEPRLWPEPLRTLEEVENLEIILNEELDGTRVHIHVIAHDYEEDVAEGEIDILIEAKIIKQADVILEEIPECYDCARLSVFPEGSGSGMVISDPAGISCGDECSSMFDIGETVVLTAEASEDSVFRGWTAEDCAGTDDCIIEITRDAAVKAEFEILEHDLFVELSGNGAGVVVSEPAGIDCGDICTASYQHGTEVSLEAIPADGDDFQGWTGECEGNDECIVTMTENISVGAVFRKTQELTVEKEGSGTGTVVSAPSGIDCGTDCNFVFGHGSDVTLVADPDTGSSFLGWDGACTGDNTCIVNMNEDKTVTAIFTGRFELTVTKDGSGSGSVVSEPAGIDCGNRCVSGFNDGESVELSATPDDGSSFVGWSGACSGSGQCIVSMSEEREVTATFLRLPPRHDLVVLKEGEGSGTVLSNPSGIDCGTECTADYGDDVIVTLTAHPDSGSVFRTWMGSCFGSEHCPLLMNEDKEVIAIFDVISYPLLVSLDGSGTGRVVSDLPGIDCGNDCAFDYEYGTLVQLEALPDDDSEFAGWRGACSGSDPVCEVTMNELRDVRASFTRRWLQVSSGGFHSCAIDVDHRLWCWGNNGNSQLGIPGSVHTLHFYPTEVVGGHMDWISVSAGSYHTCGIRSAGGDDQGTLWCWGEGSNGRLGDGGTLLREIPWQVSGGHADWIAVSASERNTCGLRMSIAGAGPTLWCWGSNEYGQLGTGDTQSRSTPSQVIEPEITGWVDVSAADDHVCSILETEDDEGILQRINYCWGRGTWGQLGYGSNVDQLTPHEVSDSHTDWLNLTTRGHHSCGVREINSSGKGRLWCWGSGTYGRLGNGGSLAQNEPVEVYGSRTDWVGVSAGHWHTCGMRSSDPASGSRLFCWGDGTHGRIGDGSAAVRQIPVEVSGLHENWLQVSASAFSHTCGIRQLENHDGGSLWCWGRGCNGQLGNGTDSDRAVPVRVR